MHIAINTFFGERDGDATELEMEEEKNGNAIVLTSLDSMLGRLHMFHETKYMLEKWLSKILTTSFFSVQVSG